MRHYTILRSECTFLPEIVIARDAALLATDAAGRFVAVAQDAVKKRGHFAVALAGGSTPAALYRLLAQGPFRDEVNWGCTSIYFDDERCVPPDHPDSNYRMAREALLDHVPIPKANIHRMPAELAPQDATAAYSSVLRREFDLRGSARPRLDLILLGMGDDGHTASLFPGMPALEERRKLVAATPAPPYARPAVPRLTLTLPVLNAACCVVFLVSGASKAGAVAHALLSGPDSGDPVPARRVCPREGSLVWLLDEAAAAGMGQERG